MVTCTGNLNSKGELKVYADFNNDIKTEKYSILQIFVDICTKL